MSLANAKSYFREHLKVGDYYSEDQKVGGEWSGKGAELLGLRGEVTEEQFLALCEGLNPATGELLTVRKKGTRQGANGEQVANRRVFYDWVVRPPKSVSIVGLTSDSRIATAHSEAVQIALKELELYAQTRVRVGGAYGSRATGNVITATFRHDTSRAQDPLIHTHCVMFNATFDPEELRWKALENNGMLRAQKLVNAVYDRELVKRLRSFGYEIQQNRESWEIAGISRSIIEKFSKRREQILEATREEMRNAGLGVDEYAVRERVARNERARKIRDAAPEMLRAKWLDELGPEGRKAVANSRGDPLAPKQGNIAEAGDWARELMFERHVSCSESELEAAIMKRLLGTDAERTTIRDEVLSKVERLGESDRLVSVEAWQRESDILAIAQAGREAHGELIPGFDPKVHSLDAEQSEAACVIAGSRDTVTLLIGDAGVGKSYTLKSVYDSLVASTAGNVLAVAPQGVQARGLTDDGIPAETLSKLLARPILPHGVVVMVDEAGQVSGKDMLNLMRRVDNVGGRVILCGDTKQHGAVAASDAMRALQNHGHLPMARLRSIRRQHEKHGRTDEEKARIAKYREAVSLAAKNDPVKSLAKMIEIGAVHKVDDSAKVAAATARYVEQTAAGETVLVVSQTRAAVAELNDCITAALESAGRVQNAQNVQAFVGMDLLAAERKEADTYREGMYVVFNRAYSGIDKGAVLEVMKVWRDSLALRDPASGMVHRVGLKHGDLWDGAEKRELRIGDGTQLLMRQNGVARNGREFSNGELLQVREIWPEEIRAVNAKGIELCLDRSKLVANLGYAVTSYSSQGKTVDRVLVVDSGSRPAQNRKEWYVSLSRGRRAAEIFTESEASLAGRIKDDGERELAVELMSGTRTRRERVSGNAMSRAIAQSVRVVNLARAAVRRVTHTARMRMHVRHGMTQ